MARRRMIDPNFWQSEDVSTLTIRQRLLLIGLFSNADDEGKLRGNPAFIRSIIFPYEDFTLEEIETDLLATELISSIHQYEVNGNKYIRLVNWSKFQRVDKPQSSVIPDPPNSTNESENESENDYGLKERKGKEVKGEEKGKEDKGPVPTFDNPLKDQILKLVKECELEKVGFDSMDKLYSFIGVVDIEVLESAVKKAQKKHINYAINTLIEWVKEGKTTKESLNVIPIKGEGVQRSNGWSGKRQIPIISETKSTPLTPEQIAEIKRKAQRLDGREDAG